MLLAVPHVSSGLPYGGKKGRAARALRKFTEKLRRIYYGEGLSAVHKRLKSLAHWCREKALCNLEPSIAFKVPFAGSVRRVLDSDPHRMFLLSQFARALAPGVGLQRKALEDHKRVLLSEPSEVPETVATPIYKFLTKHAKKVGVRGVSNARPLPSASLNRSRAQGGGMADLKGRYHAASFAWTGLLSGGPGDAIKAWPTLAANMVWRQAGIDRPAAGSTPTVRAVAVPERGAKVRVVTAGDPEEQVRAHVLRDVFWTLLRGLPVCHRGEEDENRRAQALLAKLEPGEVVVSTDLSAATDYAPFQLAKIVWSGVFRGLRARGSLTRKEEETALQEMMVHLGPHLVKWPSGEGISKRGWLMGHPLTWLTLNLAHCAILSASGLLSRAIVKGDDALVRGQPHEVQAYLEGLELAGFVVNRSKTFVSRVAGTFCERRFEVGKDYVFQIPVKRVLPPSADRCANLAYEVERLPRRLRKSYVALIWASSERSGLIKTCRSRGIPLSLPRCLGGLGLPHRKGLPGSLRAHRAWVTAAVTSLGAQEVLPLWSPKAEVESYHQVCRGLRQVTAARHFHGELGDQVPMSDALLHRFISIRSFGLGLAKPQKVQPWTYGAVGQQWAKVRKYLRSAGFPPRLINPLLWSEARLKGALASMRLAGLYSTEWVTEVTRKGLTLDNVQGAW